MYFRIVPGVRAEIFLDTHPSCCEGPIFIEEEIIRSVPIFLKGHMTDREWSTAMRRLKDIYVQETPTSCDSCFYVCCEGVKGSMWLDHRMDKLNFRLQSTIKHLNDHLFEPKGMCIAIVNDGSTLVIALNPDESRIVKILS